MVLEHGFRLVERARRFAGIPLQCKAMASMVKFKTVSTSALPFVLGTRHATKPWNCEYRNSCSAARPLGRQTSGQPAALRSEWPRRSDMRPRYTQLYPAGADRRCKPGEPSPSNCFRSSILHIRSGNHSVPVSIP
jgi:hypothetical protein